jgi:hypothetical protein
MAPQRPKRASTRAKTNPFRVKWKIVSTDVWEPASLDEFEPAHLTFESDGKGELAFIAITASGDHRLGREMARRSSNSPGPATTMARRYPGGVGHRAALGRLSGGSSSTTEMKLTSRPNALRRPNAQAECLTYPEWGLSYPSWERNELPGRPRSSRPPG